MEITPPHYRNFCYTIEAKAITTVLHTFLRQKILFPAANKSITYATNTLQIMWSIHFQKVSIVPANQPTG